MSQKLTRKEAATGERRATDMMMKEVWKMWIKDGSRSSTRTAGAFGASSQVTVHKNALMWQKVKQLNAMESKELMPNKNIFCHWCYYFSSGIQKRDQPCAGWGGHSQISVGTGQSRVKRCMITSKKRRERKKIW